MIADFFDTVGTVTAVGAEGGLLDEDRNLPKSQPVLLIDSLAAAAGGAGSVSSNTTYIESASGVADGARTGLASVGTGVLFLSRCSSARWCRSCRRRPPPRRWSSSAR